MVTRRLPASPARPIAAAAEMPYRLGISPMREMTPAILATPMDSFDAFSCRDAEAPDYFQFHEDSFTCLL